MRSLHLIGFVATAAIAGPLSAQDSLQLNDNRFVIAPKMDVVGETIVIHFPHGDVTIPRSMVKDALIAGAVDASLSTEDRSKIDQGMVKFEGKWMSVADRDKLLDRKRIEREARIKEAMSHREWANHYTLKTENFAFEYTIDPDAMKGYADLMETYYKVFTKEWGIKKPPKAGRLTVCFYHDEDYYYQVTGMQYGVVGYFRFVDPWELNFYYDRLDLDFTQDVMFHEANHYLTTLIDPKFHYPAWVNESMGEYFGASTWDPKTKKMELGGIQEGRLAVVQEAILANEWQGLEAMIRLPRFDAVHYAWGWTFVHWMLENKATQKKFKDFYLALGRDKSLKREPAPQENMKEVPADEQIRVLLKYLGIKDLKELETGWYDYIKSLKPSSGRGYFEAGQQALQADQPIRAQRLLRQAIEKGFETPTVYATLARAQRRKAQAQDAVESMRKAISMDPLNGQFYLELSRALRLANSEDGEILKTQWMALEVARGTNDPNEYAILIDLGPDFTKPDPALPPAK